MKVEIINPDKEIFNGEASLIQMPGLDGLFEVLQNHAPLIAALKKGKIKIVNAQNEVLFFEINGGVVEVQQNNVRILAE